MTTAQPFTNSSLSVDLHEDHMEMATSPFPEPHDDDIDFELDDDPEPSIEDNSMIDNIEEDADGIPTQDDIMLDEENNELLEFDQDLPMEPDETSYANDNDIDQELDNASEHYSPTYEPSSQSNLDRTHAITEVTLETTAEDEQLDEYYEKEEETNVDSTTTKNEPFDTLITAQGKLVDLPDTHSTTLDKDQPAKQGSPNTASIAIVDFAQEAAEQTVDNSDVQESKADDADNAEPPAGSSDAWVANSNESELIGNLAHELDESNKDVPPVPEALNDEKTNQSPHREASPEILHPVTVRYNGEDCWLFSPLDTSDVRHVFLQDAALASEPFDKMLAAIRPGLIENQDMADHDEIVFDIPALGLHICEDSKHASIVTLSRVIDMYMMLSQNEGLTTVEPLFCELSTRVCLADQFAYLDDAAFSRRMTYSEFVAEQAGSPEAEPQVDESVDDEDVHADTTTYYDASNEQAEQHLEPKLVEVEQSNYVAEETEDNQAVQITETVIEATQTSETQQSPANADAVQSQALPQDPSADELVVVDEVEAVLQDETHHSDSESKEQSVQETEQITKPQPDDVSKLDEADGELELEAEVEEEDLFADDVDDTLEPSATGTEQTSRIRDTESNELVDVPVPREDDLDFDNWSDDETPHNNDEKALENLVTPSKNLNGKRKLFDEDDDFLEIDVSTPEPKRNRAS